MKGKKIVRCGIRRRIGFLYYVDKDGDVCEIKMRRGTLTSEQREQLKKRKKAKLALARIRNKKLLIP